MERILFLVEMGNTHVIIYELNRETAKREAHKIIGSDPDLYTVTPLTEIGDRIFINTICLYA
jgi:hypothetical protein